MEPIKINVEMSLSEATIAILSQLIGRPAVAPAPVSPAVQVEPALNVEPVKTETAPAPAPAPVNDLPIADEELRAAVKAAKDATSAADVKSVFAEFGIKTSVDCPDDQRPALLAKLNNLAKAA